MCAELIVLFNTFKVIYSKKLNLSDLVTIEFQLPLTMCNLERILNVELGHEMHYTLQLHN